jgi:hypothetical protein
VSAYWWKKQVKRDVIPERTSVGREAARRRSIQFGRLQKLNPEQARPTHGLID